MVSHLRMAVPGNGGWVAITDKFIFSSFEKNLDLVKPLVMKNVAAALAALFCAALLLQSCSKKSQDNFNTQEPINQVLETSVVSGQPYTFNVGTPGSLTVSRQASHFQVSQTGTDENGLAIYRYSSTAGYVGADEVALAYSQSVATTGNSSGCQGSHSSDVTSTSIVIKLNVTK
jgi:hypothetical protein